MKKYYCKKCERYHYRGKIYNEHIEHKRQIIKEEHSKNDDIKIDIENLRPIAKRQLQRLFKKANSSGNHELYKNEIIKLIKDEKRR